MTDPYARYFTQPSSNPYGKWGKAAVAGFTGATAITPTGARGSFDNTFRSYMPDRWTSQQILAVPSSPANQGAVNTNPWMSRYTDPITGAFIPP